MTKFNLDDTVYTKPNVFGTGLCYKGVIVKEGMGTYME